MPNGPESLSERERSQLKLHPTRQKAKTKKHMASKTTFTTDDISTRHTTPSLPIAYLRVDDNSRQWETFRNTADTFFVPIRESMLNSFVSRKTFLVHSQKGKKCVSKDIFCSPSTIVDDNNNNHRCRQCPSSPEHFPKVRTTYIHSYKLTAQCLLLLRVVATKMKTLTNIGVWRWSITKINRN